MLQVVSDFPGRIPVLLQQGRTMWLSFFEPSGGCFSPLEIFGYLVIRTNSYTAHRTMLMIIFVSFPNRPVSLTPSISSQVSWNNWYQNFFSSLKRQMWVLYLTALPQYQDIYFLASFCRGHIPLFTLKTVWFFLVFKHLNVSILFAEKNVFFNAVFYCLYQQA